MTEFSTPPAPKSDPAFIPKNSANWSDTIPVTSRRSDAGKGGGVSMYGPVAVVLLLALIAYPLSLGPVAAFHGGKFVVAGLSGEEVWISGKPVGFISKSSGRYGFLQQMYHPLVWLCRQNDTADSMMRQYLGYWNLEYAVLWFPPVKAGSGGHVPGSALP